LRIQVAVRALTVILGCIGIAWSAWTFAIFKRDMAINSVAKRIIDGYPFTGDQLEAYLPALAAVESAPFCDPRALRSDAIIRLRIAELSLGNGDTVHVDEKLRAAREAINAALACGPTDGYLWLSLFWANAITQGTKPSDIALLRMSYTQAPREGWLMAKRNHLALVIYPALPDDLQQLAISEFRALLQPEFVNAAVDNLLGPGWSMRDVLLKATADVPQSERYVFAQRLRERGVDVAVPGINLPPLR
jgi:hypothetical protein